MQETLTMVPKWIKHGAFFFFLFTRVVRAVALRLPEILENLPWSVPRVKNAKRIGNQAHKDKQHQKKTFCTLARRICIYMHVSRRHHNSDIVNDYSSYCTPRFVALPRIVAMCFRSCPQDGWLLDGFGSSAFSTGSARVEQCAQHHKGSHNMMPASDPKQNKCYNNLMNIYIYIHIYIYIK